MKAELPRLVASLPGDVDLTVVVDRSITIRGSLRDTGMTLIASVGLVILVVFVFLRDIRASAITSVVAPVSILGSFAGMYLLGFQRQQSLVDGAHDIQRLRRRRCDRRRREYRPAHRTGLDPASGGDFGASEVGFTVVAISLSLVAVFLPLLLVGGLVGRMFREFTVTLSITVLISLFVSLTTTPMMCAYILPRRGAARHGWFYDVTEVGFEAISRRIAAPSPSRCVIRSWRP